MKPCSTERLLKPFLRRSWESSSQGVLTISGEPSSGQLKVVVWHAVGSSHKLMIVRRLYYHENCIYLGTSLAGESWEKLKLLSEESHHSTRVVWKCLNSDKREEWLASEF